ncbi:MAG: TOBE domain-containing protein, partial [Bauldia litoralis]
VTHDQIEAMTMADTIVVLRDGVVEQIGSPLELYDTPANLFVASFIGSPSMNIIEGQIRADANGSTFVTDDGDELPSPALPASSSGRPTSFGVRPEHLVLADKGFPARVTVVEPTGSETQVYMKLGGHDLVGVFRERIRVQPGETLHLTADPALIHLFDRETGARLVQ